MVFGKVEVQASLHVMKFKLWERFSETGLEVAESMEVNGKRTFGYDVPILYKRA